MRHLKGSALRQLLPTSHASARDYFYCTCPAICTWSRLGLPPPASPSVLPAFRLTSGLAIARSAPISVSPCLRVSDSDFVSVSFSFFDPADRPLLPAARLSTTAVAMRSAALLVAPLAISALLLFARYPLRPLLAPPVARTPILPAVPAFGAVAHASGDPASALFVATRGVTAIAVNARFVTALDPLNSNNSAFGAAVPLAPGDVLTFGVSALLDGYAIAFAAHLPPFSSATSAFTSGVATVRVHRVLPSDTDVPLWSAPEYDVCAWPTAEPLLPVMAAESEPLAAAGAVFVGPPPPASLWRRVQAWFGLPAPGASVVFRVELSPDTCRSLVLNADDRAQLFINGRVVLTTANYREVAHAVRAVRVGDVVAIVADNNGGGRKGVVAALYGASGVVATGVDAWRAVPGYHDLLNAWMGKDFDACAWPLAVPGDASDTRQFPYAATGAQYVWADAPTVEDSYPIFLRFRIGGDKCM